MSDHIAVSKGCSYIYIYYLISLLFCHAHAQQQSAIWDAARRPVTRVIVADVEAAVASELARLGVQRVLYLGNEQLCTLSVHHCATQLPACHCINSMKALKLQRHKPMNEADRRRTAVVRLDNAPTSQALFGAVLNRVRDLRVMVTHGTLRQRLSWNVKEKVTSKYAVVSTPDGIVTKLFFPSSSVYKEVFTHIYDKKIWSQGKGGGSGQGSTLEYTENIRVFLAEVVRAYNISSLLDSSCGSMWWMPLVLADISRTKPDFRFMGTDVTCSLIDQHRKNFTIQQANWDFKCVDYANEPLPSGYELVFSRDSLQHVPLHAAWQFLNNVRNSGARYLLVGSYVDFDQNKDVAGGSYYPINLMKRPFNATNPVKIIREREKGIDKLGDKHMLLYDMRTMIWDDPMDYLS